MTEEIRTYPSELPLVPLREMVVFPKIVQPLGVGRDKSVAAIDAAMSEEKHYVIFAAQKDPEIDDVTSDQIYTVATVAEIVRLLLIPDGSAQVIVQGLQRVRVIRYLTQQRGVNLAGVKMLLQFRDAADLLGEIANAIDEVEAQGTQRSDMRKEAKL